jgi:hypothetical protein
MVTTTRWPTSSCWFILLEGMWESLYIGDRLSNSQKGWNKARKLNDIKPVDEPGESPKVPT